MNTVRRSHKLTQRGEAVAVVTALPGQDSEVVTEVSTSQGGEDGGGYWVREVPEM